MLTLSQLAEAFERNVTIIKRQADGLTQADSLLQPPFRGNCLNWIVGHVADGRDVILKELGAEPVMGEAGRRYSRESEPIAAAGPGVLPLDELLALLDRSQAALAAKLNSLTEDDLAREIPTPRGTARLGDRLFFRYFHDTYHTGQAELLRQLAGKNDKII